MPENNSREDIRAWHLTPKQADHYRAVLATYRRQRADHYHHRNLIIGNTATITIALMLIAILISLTTTTH
jgi:hypothetical protein